MGMPGLSFSLACTQFSPAHLISFIIHYLFTEEFSGHPIHPQDFPWATLACKVLNSCRAATPSLGRSWHSLTALTNVFQNSPLDNKTANIQRKGHSTKPCIHWWQNQGSPLEKNHTGCPSASHMHLLPMWGPPPLSATAPLPALVHMHVVFNCWDHLLKKLYAWLQTDPRAACDPGEARRPC